MAKETTLTDYAILADNVYHKPSIEHELPSHIKKDNTKIKIAEANDNFHAEVYRNESSNELIIAVRGTNGLGDVADWPAAAMGTDTSQTPTAQDYISSIVGIAEQRYPGATITIVGHSLGGQQVQEMLTEVNERFVNTDLHFRGIGFNATGIGSFEADPDIYYVQVNVDGDAVKRFGFGEHGYSEVTIDLGHGPVSYDAHDMSKLAYALRLSGDQGNLTFEEMNLGENAPRLDLSVQRPQLDAFMDSYNEMQSIGDKMLAVQVRLNELETGNWRRHGPVEDDIEYQRLVEYKQTLEVRYAELQVRTAVEYEKVLSAIVQQQRGPGNDQTGSIPPLTDTGDLNSVYILSLDSPESRQAFLDSESNPDFAAVLSIEEMQRQQDAAYYEYLSGQAAEQVSRDSGIEIARLLNLDVPGNPAAPGYHGDFRGESVAWDNDAADSPYVTPDERMEADNPGSSGVESEDPWNIGGRGHDSAALGVVMSLYQLDKLIESGDTLGAVAAGAQLLDRVAPDVLSPEVAEGVGQFASVANFVRAVDGGDSSEIFISSLAVAEQFGYLPAPAGVPVIGYTRSLMLAADGEVEMAAVSAASAWLGASAALGPWGVAASMLVQLVGAGLFSKPDPRATLRFTRGEDGSVGYQTRANETGGALEEHLEGDAGEGLARLIANLEAMYAPALEGGRLDVDSLPTLALVADEKGRVEWRLEGGRHLEGAVQVLGENPTGEDIARALRDTALLTHVRASWQSGAGYLVDPLSGARITQTFYTPLGFSGDRFDTRATGTGVFAGGGNVGGRRALVMLQDSQIRYQPPPVPTATQELAAASRVWRADRGLFAGEPGQLLAMAVGAGLVSLAEAAHASGGDDLETRSVYQHERTATWAAEHDAVIGAGGGVQTPGDGLVAEAGAHGDGLAFGETSAAGEHSGGDHEWMTLYPRAATPPGGSVGESTTRNADHPRPGDAVVVPVGSDAGAGDALDDHAALIRDLSAGQDGGQDGGQGGGDEDAPASAIDGDDDPATNVVTGNHRAAGPAPQSPGDESSPPVPLGATLTVAEDRFLVTDAAHLLEGEDGSTLLDVFDARHGTLARDGNGDIVFTPDADYHGEAGFSYRIETADGAVEIRRAVVDVTAVNDQPDGVDDTLAGIEDGSVDLDALLLNDADADGESLALVAVGAPSSGRVTGSAAEGFIYVPDAHFHGEVQFTYVVADGAGANSVALATLVVAEGANDSPEVAYAVVADGVEEQPVTIDADVLLAQAADPEGDAVTLAEVTALSGGEALWDPASGAIVFLPEKDFHGTARLGFTVVDAEGGETRAEAGIAIANVTDPIQAGAASGAPPMAVASSGLTVLTAAAVLGQLEIDNLDGGAVRIVAARGIDGEAGRAVLLDDGSVAWFGIDGYEGPAAFEVRLSNGETRATARVPIDATPAGSETPGSPETDPGVAGTAEFTGTDPIVIGAVGDGTVRAGGAPSTGDATLGDTVEPRSATEPATEPVATTTSPAGEPVAEITLSGIEDQVLIFSAGDLTGGASGAELKAIALADPDDGALDWDKTLGTVTFTPAPDRFGDVAFDYTVRLDGERTEHHGAIALAPVDDAPAVSGRDYKEPWLNIDEDTPAVYTVEQLAGSAVDADGEALAATGARLVGGAPGELEITGDGRVRFTPGADFVGDATFEVDVSDGNSTVTVPVTARVWPVNDAPRTVDDAAATVEETVLRVDTAVLLANDTDVDGDTADLRVVGVWTATGGAAVLDAEAGQLMFTPDPDFHGAATVDVLVEDAAGAFSVSRLVVDVANTYDPARAVDDVIHVAEDESALVPFEALTGNDANPDGGSLTVTGIDTAGITHGEVSLSADGVRVNPESDYHGSQTFTYTLADAAGAESSATVTLVTDAVNDAPLAAPLTVAGVEDEPVTLDLDELADLASDVEGDWTWVTAVSSPDGEIDVDPASGRVTFIPNAHLNRDLNGGPLVLDYRLVDEGGASAQGVVRFDLAPVNDVPEAHDDAVLVWEAGPGGYVNPIAEADLLFNDVEHDGDTLAIGEVGGPAQPGARLSLDPLGTPGRMLHYRAAEGFTGADVFTYTVGDGVPGSLDSAGVEVLVLGNRAPVAHDIAAVADEDTVLVFDAAVMAAHVDDPDRTIAGLPEELTVVEVGGAFHGSVALDDGGRIVFSPDANFNSVEGAGAAGFDYVVEDIVGNRASASASIVFSPVNDAPIGASEHLGAIDEDGAGLEFTGAQLLANDVDIEGDPLAVTAVRASSGRVDSVGADTWRFVPGDNFNGQAKIVYTVSDGDLVDEVVSTITVRPVNDRPIVEFDAASGYDNSTLNTASGLLANDSDVDGDALSIGRITGASGNVVVRGVGRESIAWEATSAGSGYIRYEVTDGHGGVTESRLDLSIAHKAVPPQFVGYTQGSYEGTYRNVSVHTSNGGSLTIRVQGHVNAWDPDGSPGDLRYYAGPGLTMTSSGAWTYTHTFRLQESDGGPGNWVTRTIDTSNAVSVVDAEGNIATMSMPISYTARIQMDIQGKPVVLDLDGNGIQLIGAAHGEARFDWDGDGAMDRTGWIAGDGDALLAYDHDGDKTVTRADEIAFVGYAPGSNTDLEALAAFDTNKDGSLDPGDTSWSYFGVWRDDGDGVSEDGEFTSLDDAGIASISLESDEETAVVDGNVVHGQSTFTRVDGVEGVAGDVGFGWIKVGNHDEAEGGPASDVAENNEGHGITDPVLDESAVESAADTMTSTGKGSGSSMDAMGPAAGNHPSRGETPESAESAGAVAHVGLDGVFLPDNEEFDRMASADIEQVAAMRPRELVAALPMHDSVPGDSMALVNDDIDYHDADVFWQAA